MVNVSSVLRAEVSCPQAPSLFANGSSHSHRRPAFAPVDTVDCCHHLSLATAVWLKHRALHLAFVCEFHHHHATFFIKEVGVKDHVKGPQRGLDDRAIVIAGGWQRYADGTREL